MWIVWPFKKKNFGSAWTVCADFRRFIDDTIGEFIIQDEKKLPHSKAQIFEAMCIQLYPLGIDIDSRSEAADGPAHFAISAKTNLAGKEKYDRFKSLRDAEWDRMKATMERILRRPR